MDGCSDPSCTVKVCSACFVVAGFGRQLPVRLGRGDARFSAAMSEAPLAWRQHTAAHSAGTRHVLMAVPWQMSYAQLLLVFSGRYVLNHSVYRPLLCKLQQHGYC